MEQRRPLLFFEAGEWVYSCWCQVRSWEWNWWLTSLLNCVFLCAEIYSNARHSWLILVSETENWKWNLALFCNAKVVIQRNCGLAVNVLGTVTADWSLQGLSNMDKLLYCYNFISQCTDTVYIFWKVNSQTLYGTNNCVKIIGKKCLF